MECSRLIAELESCLPKRVFYKSSTLYYDHIWESDISSKNVLILMPTSTEEVSKICKICHELKRPIIIHGGRTGLVGATRSKNNNIIINLGKFNRIHEIDHISRTITLDPGVILEEINNKLADFNLKLPISFGSKGSAQIGGCIATNAGGNQVMKYGMIRNWVMGLEIVLPDGTIINSIKKLHKDNSGYNLNQLFIGSEGTLGIITKAVLKLTHLRSASFSAYVAFDKFENIITFLNKSQINFTESLTGFELFYGNTFEILVNLSNTKRPPIVLGYKYYILFEIESNNEDELELELESFLEISMQNRYCSDCVIAYNKKDNDWFWNIRESVGNLNSRLKFTQHFDISLPLEYIEKYIKDVTFNLKQRLNIVEVYPFGHLADGNMHFIIGKMSNDVILKNKINHIVYSPLKELGGSISAEHGIGIDKTPWLKYTKTEEEINLMKLIKKTIDPRNILNPNRLIEI